MMSPQISHNVEEWRLRSAIEKCSTGQIVALVHAKLLSLADRRAFETERRDLNHRDLVTLAAKTLANAAPRASGRYPVAPRAD
ncbi:MAG: hypothetical protein ACLQVI_00660 [Polyangiaceae bacterium]|jgi:hypothetical protein